MSFETPDDVERKVLEILKVLHSLKEPAGARVIARHLVDHGITLGERAVRYHLKLTDERGLTELVGNQDGRVITGKGQDEIRSALVKDKVGFAISKIELLAFRTNFDYLNRRGAVPVNVSIFAKNSFAKALKVMKQAFDGGLCASQLVAVADGGQKLGDVIIPEGKIGLATVCSIIINGTLLKSGIPMDSRFGGILQLRNHKPMRFTEVIHYDGCSLDPSEIFIKARMTSVGDVVSTGSGRILANFREIPSICLPVAERVLEGLRSADLGGLIIKGNPSEPVCEIPMELNKIGMVITGGLNPVAAAHEAGIEAENHSMSTVIDYKELVKFPELLSERSKNYALS